MNSYYRALELIKVVRITIECSVTKKASIPLPPRMGILYHGEEGRETLRVGRRQQAL